MSECFVSEKDYRRHFDGDFPNIVNDIPAWHGEERRIGPKDRRADSHERRWDKARGRRFRIADRRKTHR